MTRSERSVLVLRTPPTRRRIAARIAATFGILVAGTALFATLPAWRAQATGNRVSIRLADPIPLAALATAAPFRFSETPTIGAAPFRAGAQSALDAARAQLCLTSAVYYEAASESEDGQRAVAQVVLNRVRHPAFPNSVCGVVFQGADRPGCQFTFACDGALLRQPSRSGWAMASRIAREALAGMVYAPVGSATNYHAYYVSPNWEPRLTRFAIVGAHIFYRIRGPIGDLTAFRQPYALREPLPGPYPQRVLASAPVPLPDLIDASRFFAMDGAAAKAVSAAPPAPLDIQPQYVGSGAPTAAYEKSVTDSQIRPEWRDSGTVIER